MRPRACNCTFAGHAIYTNFRFPALKIFIKDIFLVVFLQGLVLTSFLYKTSCKKNCQVFKFILNAVNPIVCSRLFSMKTFGSRCCCDNFLQYPYIALCLWYLLFPLIFFVTKETPNSSEIQYWTVFTVSTCTCAVNL